MYMHYSGWGDGVSTITSLDRYYFMPHRDMNFLSHVQVEHTSYINTLCDM